MKRCKDACHALPTHVTLLLIGLLIEAELTGTDSVETDPVGHLKPLGSHRPKEGDADVLHDGFPDPAVFFRDYVHASKPVLFKNAAKGIPAFSLWTDQYLKETFGDLTTDCEEGKKENRSQNMVQMPMSKFLDVYQTRDIYMVQDVHPEMRVDLSLPRSLQCGGFQDVLELSVMWFSSGGTKSVLHLDSIDNINCLFDGEKTLVMIDKKFSNEVEADNFVTEGGFSRVDVDRVDFKKYPSLAKVDWWSAKMETGDCFFIPQGWYHTVDSSKSRNLAVNLWFIHLLWFNQTDCDKREEPLEDYSPLTKHDIATFMGQGEGSPEKLRQEVFSPFEGLDKVTSEDALRGWLLEDDDLAAIFEVLDLNKDLELSWEEMFSADVMSLMRTFPFLIPEMDEEDAEIFHEMLERGSVEVHDEL